MRSKINFEHIKRVDELDATDQDDRRIIMQAQKKMDNHLIACISKAVQRQLPGMALDLTTNLSLSKSIDIAIKLAVKKQMPMLADRMSLAKLAHVEQRQRAHNTQARAAQQYSSPPVSAARHRPQPSASRLSTPSSAGGRTPLNLGRQQAPPSSNKRSFSQREQRAISEEPSADEQDEDAGSTEDTPTQQKGKSGEQTPWQKPAGVSKLAGSSNPFSSNPFAKKAGAAKKSSVVSNVASTDAAAAKTKKGSMFLKQAGSSKPGKVAKKAEEAGQKPKRHKKDADAPKKGLSSYMLWLKDARAGLKKEFPDVKNAELLTKAGEKWQGLGDEKQTWIDLAAQKKAEYTAALAKYLAGDEEEADTAAAMDGEADDGATEQAQETQETQDTQEEPAHAAAAATMAMAPAIAV